ncbi:MAG: AlpA family phage regulatory protein [Sphingorhabdus sp.]
MPQEQESIIRIATVLQRTGLSRSTLYRKINDGSFPPQVQISTHCAGWYESAVKTWIDNPQFYHVNDFPRKPLH